MHKISHSYGHKLLLLLLLLLLSLINWTANGLLPGGSGDIRHNTQKYTYHTKYHTMHRQNTTHKATQTIKGTLRTMNTTQKKGNAIPVTGLETWEYGRGDPLRWPRDTLYPEKLALTSPTRRSLGWHTSLAGSLLSLFYSCNRPLSCNRPVLLVHETWIYWSWYQTTTLH
jgi:hypothetical protein